jgi:hypothetical protein
VTPKFASFDTNLDRILQAELGEHFADQRSLVAIKYGLKIKAATKNPVSCAEIIENCLNLGGGCATLGSVIDAISELA